MLKFGKIEPFARIVRAHSLMDRVEACGAFGPSSTLGGRTLRWGAGVVKLPGLENLGRVLRAREFESRPHRPPTFALESDSISLAF